MDFVDNFDFHRANPQQSFEDYYRELRIGLGRQISGKILVYLDTKFWVLLRNGLLNPQSNPKECELLKLASELVGSKVCVFPISENVFLEVVKQSDIKTLKATVQLIDSLSLGVSTISQEERIKLEIIHFWYSTLGKRVYKSKELVWTKLPYLMGIHSFIAPHFSQEENLVIQKAFVDQMWSISMSDMIDTIQANGRLDEVPELSLADKLNEGKFRYQNEAKSFKQLFLNEVGGMIDLYNDDLADMMEYMYTKETGQEATNGEFKEHRKETKRLMGNMIYNLFRLNKVGTNLPSIRIMSSLHASVRWDKKQKYQDHDLHDFSHATSALPYCDYFFTEKRLHHLLSQKALSLHELYNCNIQSKLSGALQALKHIKLVENRNARNGS